MSLFHIRGFVLLLPLALLGCVGTSKYACPGMPEGVACASTHEVYEMTGHGAKATRSSAGAKSQSATPVKIERNDFLPEVSGGVIPLRTPAKVMRIWIGLWEGENGDLHVPGLIYTEIEPRRWQAGLPAIKEPSEIILLEPRPVPATSQPKAAIGSAAKPSPQSSATPQSKSITGDK